MEEWPTPPEQGPEIRHRKVWRSGRLGSAEPKVIVAETRDWVVYRVWSAGGRDLGEHCMSKSEFEKEFERKNHG